VYYLLVISDRAGTGFKDSIHCTEEDGQVIHRHACSVSRESITNQLPKLP
jgi:hypothetical protein